jgi:hypothetical protein
MTRLQSTGVRILGLGDIAAASYIREWKTV